MHEIDHLGYIHLGGIPYEGVRTNALTSRVLEQALSGDVPFIDMSIKYEGNQAWARLEGFRLDETDENFAVADIAISKHETIPDSLEVPQWEHIEELFRVDKRTDTVVRVLDQFLFLAERPDAEAHPHRKKLAVALGTTAVVVGLAGIQIWRHRHKKAKA